MPTYSPIRKTTQRAPRGKSGPSAGAGGTGVLGVLATQQGAQSWAGPVSPGGANETTHDQMRMRTGKALNNARRHVRTMRRVRWLFGTGMVVLPVLVIAISLFNSVVQSDIAYANARIAGENIRIERPVFDGKDSHNSRYQIVSDAVTRRFDDADRLSLENPTMTLKAGDDDTVVLQSEEGVYNREEKTLSLSGSVKLTSSTGYNFDTSQARIYLRSGIAEGEAPITGTGPMGTITAQGFQLDQNERQVVFYGNETARVVGTIFPNPDLVEQELKQSGGQDADVVLRQ